MLKIEILIGHVFMISLSNHLEVHLLQMQEQTLFNEVTQSILRCQQLSSFDFYQLLIIQELNTSLT